MSEPMTMAEMTAARAQKAAVESAKSIVEHMRPDIDKLIFQASSLGKSELTYFPPHMECLVAERLWMSLRMDGFKVNHVDNPDPGHPGSSPYTTISW